MGSLEPAAIQFMLRSLPGGQVTIFIHACLDLRKPSKLCYWFILYSCIMIIYVTEFWKITHMSGPETIRIFDFSMALLIAETTFKKY